MDPMPEREALRALAAVNDDIREEFEEVIARWKERLEVGTPHGVPAVYVRLGLEACFRDALENAGLPEPDEEDA